MNNNILLGLLLSLFLSSSLANTETEPHKKDDKIITKADMKNISSTADHSKLKELNQDFKTPQEVTKACLGCHTEADNQLMHTVHFSWAYKQKKTGQQLGKRHVINSFCGNVATNEARCTSCHTGYGWTDMRKDPPADPNAIDCLVCHDRSGQYAKQSNLAGLPPLEPVSPKAKTITGKKAWAVDLAKSAQSVGKTSRDNCGSCHFYGGGGDNVKHGDLSSVLSNPSHSVDVHMSKDGANMSCSSCHVQDKHSIAGSRYETLPSDHPKMTPGASRDTASCQSCHGERPHPNNLIGTKLNNHTNKLACQSCHIPEFARGGVATKTLWDWSTAGKLKDGKPYGESHFKQSNGKERHTYMSKKGDFKWGENVVPYYAWYDGTVTYANADTKIDPSKTVSVNSIGGDVKNPASRIWPFKRMIGKQAYDTELNELVYTNVYGPKSKTAYWKNFDWQKSITYAMEYMNEPYSGKFDFVDTEMFWPITHMVAPSEDAVECQSCHQKESRLADVPNIYLPGGQKEWGFNIGLIMLIATALGVFGHALIRIFSHISRRRA